MLCDFCISAFDFVLDFICNLFVAVFILALPRLRSSYDFELFLLFYMFYYSDFDDFCLLALDLFLFTF